MNFEARHIGPHPTERNAMVRELGYDSNEALLKAVVPASILTDALLDLPAAVNETEVLRQLREIADRNVVPVRSRTSCPSTLTDPAVTS